MVRTHNDDGNEDCEPAQDVDREDRTFCKRQQAGKQGIKEEGEENDGVEDERALVSVSISVCGETKCEIPAYLPTLNLIFRVIERRNTLNDHAA